MKGFHPIVEEWFLSRFNSPTPPQQKGWPFLQKNQHTLIAAPTGSGKTMAAFLVAIDRLVRQALDNSLEPGLQIIYVSPLRALSNDVKKNLEEPLAEISQLVESKLGRKISISIGLRTGDSTASERSRLLKDPPHILVTTPESLYLLLTAEKGRALLKPCNTIIVDEIHALARDKRGSHLSLSIARLNKHTDSPLVRVGLSATMKPLDDIARFLCGEEACAIIDESSHRKIDIATVLPPSPLSAVCSHEQWSEIFLMLADAVKTHRSTLIFVNTRRMAERVSFHLAEILGEDAVSSHHGSLSKDARHSAEQRLKSGELKAVVATASLELGIDVGYIDLVCQIGSPRSIAVFMQRIGRSGHALGLVPKGRLFALTRDELFECYALTKACLEKDMDSIEIPEAPLDILAQQIVAICSAEEYSLTELYQLIRTSWAYRNLTEDDFNKIIEILSNGISPRSRKGAYLHLDQINNKVKGRRNARLSALTSGGAIPEQNLYRVVTGENGTFVGTLDEDFAIESSRGDIFLLGTTSWQVEAVRQGQVIVHDAGGAPPSIPFWFGEAPGRTFELSGHVSQLREGLNELLGEINVEDTAWELDHMDLPEGLEPAAKILQDKCNADEWGIKQILLYCATQKAATGFLPKQDKIIFERFFDDTGGMQLVVHAPYGTRINRAWGLAFRKRFCRGFDFELQASADDNGIVLSVGPNQSFPIDALFNMLNSKNCKDLLVQALLDVPMFQVRWRWNVTRALAVLRFRGGKKVPPHLQRYQSDDLLTAVFPQQTQCFEHRTGDLEVPDHPYVIQTVTDCLTEAMDIHRFEELMKAKDDGEIDFIGIDTREPSPFSYELINANPYAFLDEAPLEERRTRAVFTRRTLDPKDFDQLSILDHGAIKQVQREAWPLARDADEFHDALNQMVVLAKHELGPWESYIDTLLASKRAFIFASGGEDFVCTTENISLVKTVYDPHDQIDCSHVPERLLKTCTWEESVKIITNGQLEVRGPITANDLAEQLSIDAVHISAALASLESDGLILSGSFSNHDLKEKEWCDRRLLSRIHRLTIEGLRQAIKPASRSQFMKFLISHQHASPDSMLMDESGTLRILQMMMGYEAPCSAWEAEFLSARIRSYQSQYLDQLCFNGIISWGRLKPPPRSDEQKGKGSLVSKVMAITLYPRTHLSWLLPPGRENHEEQLSHDASKVYQTLLDLGAPFFEDLCQSVRLPKAAVEDALGELVSLGLASADGFEAIRPLIAPDRRRRSQAKRRNRRQMIFETGFQKGGRWSQFPGHTQESDKQERLENWAILLLERYGVIFRDLLSREKLAPQWRDLLPIYRRLEMRGEIRGGRFVEGMPGEQFALAESIDKLRSIKKHDIPWVVLSACDPLNLAGIMDKNPKIPALPGNRIVYENGELIAYRDAGSVHFTKDFDNEKKEILERAIRLNGSFRHRDPFIKDYQKSKPEDQVQEKKQRTGSHLNWSQIKRSQKA